MTPSQSARYAVMLARSAELRKSATLLVERSREQRARAEQVLKGVRHLWA
jgi:hypothetical protein